MKEIKTFTIGFLTCCCLFLIMGQTKTQSKYQFAVTKGIDIGETFYLYDNETEDVQILHGYRSKDDEQKWYAMNVDFRRNYKQGEKEILEKIKEFEDSQGN